MEGGEYMKRFNPLKPKDKKEKPSLNANNNTSDDDRERDDGDIPFKKLSDKEIGR